MNQRQSFSTGFSPVGFQHSVGDINPDHWNAHVQQGHRPLAGTAAQVDYERGVPYERVDFVAHHAADVAVNRLRVAVKLVVIGHLLVVEDLFQADHAV